MSAAGLFCPAGGFHVDPWGPAERALVTHAHSDHARRGSRSYLAHRHSIPVMRQRLGGGAVLQGIDYGVPLTLGEATVTLFPAGHVPGSAQIRISGRGQTWVFTGDYKLEADGVSVPFEPVACDVLVTESTFGLPIYRWPRQAAVVAEMVAWCAECHERGEIPIVLAYSLGKAQRVAAALAPYLPVFADPQVHAVNTALESAGVVLPRMSPLGANPDRARVAHGLVIAPTISTSPPWLEVLAPVRTASVSGWMSVRAFRGRRGGGHGFVMSDHADWDGLNAAIAASGAKRVFTTHGYAEQLARRCRELGLEAEVLETRFSDEERAVAEEAP